ncbi:hypothetical protein JNO04_05305 [Halomonas sp. MC140]|nr:hypothetical protein [Halomonas sp. MC140]MDN7131772.1 hypothetical protein [Halomonas sp. MC140]
MQTHIAIENDQWAVCWGITDEVAIFAPIQKGLTLSTGQPNMEIFDDRALAVTRMKELMPVWEDKTEA